MRGVDTLCLAELPDWHAHGFVWSSAYERVALPSLGNARAGKPALLQPVEGASLCSEHWAHTLADKMTMNLPLRLLLPRRLAAPSPSLPRLVVFLSPALSSLSLSRSAPMICMTQEPRRAGARLRLLRNADRIKGIIMSIFMVATTVRVLDSEDY